MVCTSAVGLIAFFEMARLKDQVSVLNGSPDVLARVAIAPLQDQPILVFIETSLSIEVIAIKHLQNSVQLTVLDDLGYLRGHLCRRSSVQVFFGDMQCSRRVLFLANHLLNHFSLFIREAMSLA